MTEEWLRAGLPRHRAVALGCLHVRQGDAAPGKLLDEREWRRLLEYCDRSGLTLFVADRLGPAPPLWVRERTECNLARNRQRLQCLEETHRAVTARLYDAGVPFALLKGLTQPFLSGLATEQRQQYDIDLLTLPCDAHRAVAAVSPLGFEPHAAMERFPTDHLPPLIRRTGWEFRGDYFDPEIPVSVEIHFQLWDERFSRLPAPGVAEFFDRRVVRELGIGHVPVLARVDALAYASLHLLKHLLQGSVRPFHVYELASMLRRHRDDPSMWKLWIEQHDPAMRRLQAIGFRLAEQWFGSRLPEAVEAEWGKLPGPVHGWFDEFALAPAAPGNKAELWLHCALLTGNRDRLAVAQRRLLPLRLPPPVDAVYLDRRALTWRRTILRWVRETRFLAGRIRHHAVAAVHFAASAARWWRRARLTHS